MKSINSMVKKENHHLIWNMSNWTRIRVTNAYINECSISASKIHQVRSSELDRKAVSVNTKTHILSLSHFFYLWQFLYSKIYNVEEETSYRRNIYLTCFDNIPLGCSFSTSLKSPTEMLEGGPQVSNINHRRIYIICLPILDDSMLLATRGVVCRDVSHPPFSAKKVTGLPMHIQGLCPSNITLRNAWNN